MQEKRIVMSSHQFLLQLTETVDYSYSESVCLG